MTEQRITTDEPKIPASVIADALISAIKRLRAQIAADAKCANEAETKGEA